MKFPFREFQQQYGTEDACLDKVFTMQYGAQPHCPKCNRKSHFRRVRGRKCYACTHCSHHLYPLVGTAFERSSTPLTVWFHAIYLITASRNGVSAKELERQLGVTYKTAWRMGHRIRTMMVSKEPITLGSPSVQADETYCGGRRKGRRGRANDTKTPVFGLAEPKGGRVMATVVPDATRATLFPIIEQHVPKPALIMTDEFTVYNPLSKLGYFHGRVQHKSRSYVDQHGNTTNAIEGFWSILKRSIRGTHVWVSARYLQRCVDEYVFRYNNRKADAPLFEVIFRSLSPLCRKEKSS